MNPQTVQPQMSCKSSSLKWLSIVGVICYMIAPWLNALKLDQDGTLSDYPGWPLLFFGWLDVMSVADGKYNSVGWMANPLFVLGTVTLLIGERRFACISLMLSCLFTFTAVLLKEVLINEAGHTANVVGFQMGFWLWTAAIWFNLLVALLSCLLVPTSAHSLDSRRSRDSDLATHE